MADLIGDSANAKNLWQLLWEYDPNGLVVFDENLNIQLTNPAFKQIFNFSEDDLVGRNLKDSFSQVEDYQKIITSSENRLTKERYYPDCGCYVRVVLFKVESENLYACIVVDQTEKWKREKKLHEIQEEAVKRLNELTTKQMMAAQSIASLLGETTAETKTNVLKLQHLLETDSHADELH